MQLKINISRLLTESCAKNLEWSTMVLYVQVQTPPIIITIELLFKKKKKTLIPLRILCKVCINHRARNPTNPWNTPSLGIQSVRLKSILGHIIKEDQTPFFFFWLNGRSNT